MARLGWHWVALLTLPFLLGGCPGLFTSLPPLSPNVEKLPSRLSETGLYADAKLTVIANGARPYAPRFELWSDGASKRRWVRLPPNTRIDTSDMEDWEFPVGTELWKEFSRDGKRVETRLIKRVSAAPGGWAGVAYAWTPDQREALAVADGLEDALETAHDVPEARECTACHGGRRHFVLGFSAIQLSHAAQDPEELTLEKLVAEQALTRAPSSAFELPGTPAERAALGYLHANCGGCHNSERPEDAGYAPPSGLDLWLRTTCLATPAETPIYRTAIPSRVKPGNPQESKIFRRVANPSLFAPRMPPIASEVRDEAGVRVLETWIKGLKP